MTAVDADPGVSARRGGRAALWLMVATVIVDGLLPTFRVLVDEVGTLWMVVWVQFGAVTAHSVYIATAAPNLVVAATRIRWRRHLRSPYLAGCAVARLGVLLLFGAVSLLGPTVPAVLWALWPIPWTLGLIRTAKDSQGSRYRRVTSARWVATLVACGGCAAVAVSQPASIWPTGWVLAAGLVMCAVGVAVDGANVLSFRWGIDLCADTATTEPRDETAGAVAAVLIGTIISTPVVAATAVVAGQPTGGIRTFAVCVALGVCYGVGSVTNRAAHSATTTATLVALGSWSPVITAAILAAAGHLVGFDTIWLGVGVAAVAVGGYVATTTPPQPQPRHRRQGVGSRRSLGAPAAPAATLTPNASPADQPTDR